MLDVHEPGAQGLDDVLVYRECQGSVAGPLDKERGEVEHADGDWDVGKSEVLRCSVAGGDGLMSQGEGTFARQPFDGENFG